MKKLLFLFGILLTYWIKFSRSRKEIYYFSSHLTKIFRTFALDCGKSLSGGACMILLVKNITTLAVIWKI